MSSDDTRVENIKRQAYGRWTPLLEALGVPRPVLNRRNQPCPIAGCGGRDRFQYTDCWGEGNYHCRSCGAGGGLKLAQGALGMRFPELLDRIEREVGALPQSPVTTAASGSPQRRRELCQRLWSEARPIAPGDEVDRYLRARGLRLERYPATLRCHPALGYFEKPDGASKARQVAEYPAMLALVQNVDGIAVTLHRTYVAGGRKALGDGSRKLLSAGVDGAAVKLDEAGDELAVAEGIETALAVRQATAKPTWAALSCGNLEKLRLPDGVRRVCIYADNDGDAEFSGQLAAYTLANRLVREARRHGLERVVRVFLPRRSGADWADVWQAKLLANDARAA